MYELLEYNARLVKRTLATSAFVVALTALWFFGLRSTVETPVSARKTPPAPVSEELASQQAPPASARVEGPLEELDMAKELNASGKTIRDDLILLDGMFSAWQSNFLKEGNPVGTNAEITAALIGQNPLRLAFVSPKHPSINSAGELCDRWGTPFFFHQLSGFRMEIHSAGPDRKRGTPDDAVISQGGEE